MSENLLRTGSILTLAALFACSSSEMMTPPQATIQSLSVAVDIASPVAGDTVTATARGVYSDGTEKEVTAGVTFRSTKENVLEPILGQPGKFLCKTAGAAQILAIAGDAQALATVQIGQATVQSLEIIPPSGLIGRGGSLKVAVVATYTNGHRDQVTKDVALASSAPGVLLPSSEVKGELVTFGMGDAMVTATLDGKSISGMYTVTPPRIDYMVINPQNARISQMMPLQYSVMGHWTDGRYEDVTTSVEWSSSDPAIATIDGTGLATAVGEGTAVIEATRDGVTAATTARTVTTNCDYPANPPMEVSYDDTMPPLFWVDAYDQAGNTVDFQLGDAYCDSASYSSILFLVVAGWCPNCPAYMQRVEAVADQLEAAGMQVVYVAIETDSGAPANNEQANTIITREIENTGKSIRVGDGVSAGSLDRPFSRAVQFVPTAFVVRTSDMHVIADQARSETYLDLVAIANDPDRLW